MEHQIIEKLSSTGNHEDCLQACQQLLLNEPENPLPWKYAGKSLLALEKFKKAQQCLSKAHLLDNTDPEIIKDLGNIFNSLQNDTEAIKFYEAALSIDNDYAPAINNLGLIAKRQGKLTKAEKLIKRACELDQSCASYHMNLASIYKDKGNLDQALSCMLKSLKLKPYNSDAHMNLGGIYKHLGNFDLALNSTLKSLEIDPHNSRALYSLGSIKMALGKTREARKTLIEAIKKNPQEYGAYYEISTMLETKEEANELIKAIKSAQKAEVTHENTCFIEFTISNCFHKAENYNEASKHLEAANKSKLMTMPSNLNTFRQAIARSLSDLIPTETSSPNSGKGRIFIVGMPRSGSTLLETILSMNQEIKGLGESRSLGKAIAKFKQQQCKVRSLDELYSRMEYIDGIRYKYSTDKQLYNFININWITTHLPAAKIIHCKRNPMDNILSMYRSNLTAGYNYTASLKDSAQVLIAQEQAMRIHKRRNPKNIFTFNYEPFVNLPEANLRKLLEWLGLNFDYNYLHPEKSTRSIITASVMQARKPISNKSVGGWKNYENLLQPALEVLRESDIQIE